MNNIYRLDIEKLTLRIDYSEELPQLEIKIKSENDLILLRPSMKDIEHMHDFISAYLEKQCPSHFNHPKNNIIILPYVC